MKHTFRSLGAGVAAAALLSAAGLSGIAGAQTPPAPRPHIGVIAEPLTAHDVLLTEYGAKLPNGGPYAVVEQVTRYGYTTTTISNSVGDSQPELFCDLPGTTSCLLAIRDESTGATIAFDRVSLPAKVPPMGKAPAPYRATGPEHVQLAALLSWTPPDTPPDAFDPQALLTGGQTVPGRMYADVGAEWGPRPLTGDELVVSHGADVVGYYPGVDAEANVVGGSPGRWSEQLLSPSGRQLAEVSTVIPRLSTPLVPGPVVPPQGRAGLINVSGSTTYHVAPNGQVSAAIDPGWATSHVNARFPQNTILVLWYSASGVDSHTVWGEPAHVTGGAANEPVILRRAGVWSLVWYVDGRAVAETQAVVPQALGQ